MRLFELALEFEPRGFVLSGHSCLLSCELLGLTLPALELLEPRLLLGIASFEPLLPTCQNNNAIIAACF